jgi:hypothetical protein
MEPILENTISTNDHYSFEASPNTSIEPLRQEDNYFFDELNPAKLWISDIIY